jgi:hypothetical protein
MPAAVSRQTKYGMIAAWRAPRRRATRPDARQATLVIS